MSAVPARTGSHARLLHTSDWHLGVTCRGESRARDHDAVIARIVDVAADAAPDLIVHTGDLFDGSRPGYDDILRGILALRRLSEVAPLLVLRGNHDSEGLLRVVAEAFGDTPGAPFDPYSDCAAPVRILTKPCAPEIGAVATYPSASGPAIRIGCLPFVHANRVLRSFDDLADDNATYADWIGAITAVITKAVRARFDPATQVAVWASHLHIDGARLSSERQLHVSSAYATDTVHLDKMFSYLAFGHIHKPQDLPGGRTGRYAGSILEVDFGEEGEDKVVVVVDMEPATFPIITTVPIVAGRRLRRPHGTLVGLTAMAAELGDAICEVTVDAAPIPDQDTDPDADADPVADQPRSLALAVQAALPDATIVGIIDARHRVRALDEQAVAPVVEATLSEAFIPYAIRNGHIGPIVGRLGALFDELLTSVELGEPSAPAAAAAIEALVAAAAEAGPLQP